MNKKGHIVYKKGVQTDPPRKDSKSRDEFTVEEPLRKTMIGLI